MDYSYVAYTADRKLVKGKISATNEEAAGNLLSYGGYQVVSLKSVAQFFNMEKLLARFHRIQPREIMMFSRQLALLLESGTDIVTALDLLQGQLDNQSLKRMVGEVASDIRGGASFSTALSQHPRAFSQMYHRAVAAGEQSGNLELVLRQMAEHIEKGTLTEKKIKGALTYPIIVAIVAVVVVALMVTFVFPAFEPLYSAFGAEPPFATKLLMSITTWLTQYGLYLLLGLIAIVVVAYLYIRTPAGQYQWHELLLRMPVVGRINQLTELSRCCRTMSLLFRVGLPLPEIMAMAIHASNNKVVEKNLTEVQQELIRGEGLSKPMSQRKVFLPLMVQMVKVGEESGHLDDTLTTVAENFEVEADDKTSSAVGLIQPAMTIIMGLVIAFIALALISAMYSVYGQVNL
ncbi:MAG: type II secretion system F family protein [Dehalococcoidales bacterium]|nr:type II secretion system F family protein [Dehalococcoidales bacterium]